MCLTFLCADKACILFVPTDLTHSTVDGLSGEPLVGAEQMLWQEVTNMVQM